MSDKVSRINVQIRYRDLDSLGHVNNAVHLTYFEMGRVSLLEKFIGKLDPNNVGFVIVHSEVDYRKPIYLSSRLEVETTISQVGDTSFTFSHVLNDLDARDKPFAYGKTVGVLIDSEGRKMKLPEDFRKMLE